MRLGDSARKLERTLVSSDNRAILTLHYVLKTEPSNFKLRHYRRAYPVAPARLLRVAPARAYSAAIATAASAVR